MRRTRSPLVILFVLFLAPLSRSSFAIGVPRSCQVRSAELKLARECYTGDMRQADDAAMFVGLDQTSPVDLNYCFNTFVAPYPVQKGQLSMMVIKDDAKGNSVARTYTVTTAALAATLGRMPTNRKAQVLSLGGLAAQCYAKNPVTDKCSKGLFGWGGTDLPLAVALENDPHGYRVVGGVRDRVIIDLPGVPTVASRGVSAPAATLDWLTGQVKQRLLSRGRRDLATLTAAPDDATRARVSAGASQFQFCRLAFDGLNQRLRRPAAFSAEENKMFEEYDQAIRGPGVAAPSAVAPIVSVPASAAPRVPAAQPSAASNH